MRHNTFYSIRKCTVDHYGLAVNSASFQMVEFVPNHPDVSVAGRLFVREKQLRTRKDEWVGETWSQDKGPPFLRQLQTFITDRVEMGGIQPTQSIMRATSAFVTKALERADLDTKDPNIDRRKWLRYVVENSRKDMWD